MYEHLNIKKERNVLNDSIDSRKKLLIVLNDMFKMFSYTTKFETLFDSLEISHVFTYSFYSS